MKKMEGGLDGGSILCQKLAICWLDVQKGLDRIWSERFKTDIRYPMFKKDFTEFEVNILRPIFCIQCIPWYYSSLSKGIDRSIGVIIEGKTS